MRPRSLELWGGLGGGNFSQSGVIPLPAPAVFTFAFPPTAFFLPAFTFVFPPIAFFLPFAGAGGATAGFAGRVGLWGILSCVWGSSSGRGEWTRLCPWRCSGSTRDPYRSVPPLHAAFSSLSKTLMAAVLISALFRQGDGSKVTVSKGCVEVFFEGMDGARLGGRPGV